MNLSWMLVLAGVDAVLVVAVIVLAAGMRGLRRLHQRSLSESAELRASLAALQSEMEKAKALEPESAPREAPLFVPAAGLNADKRAEALEMLRRGMDSASVSAKLQLSQAEAALLEKIQGLLGAASEGRR